MAPQARQCLLSVESAPDTRPLLSPIRFVECLPRLIIRLIIHTILLDPSRAVWTDEASNVSSLDPSGADQIDAEHQATDLADAGSNPSRRAKHPGQCPNSKGSS